METFNRCMRYIFYGRTDFNNRYTSRNKSELNEIPSENWSHIPDDPLRKNLGDYVGEQNRKNKETQNYWTVSNITPQLTFIDEFRYETMDDKDVFSRPASWHRANGEPTRNNSVGNQTYEREVLNEMNPKIQDCHYAASHCSNKLEELKMRLKMKSPIKPRPKKTKKQYVDSKAIEDSYVDALVPEHLSTMANDDRVNHNQIGEIVNRDLVEIDGPLVRVQNPKVFKNSPKSALNEITTQHTQFVPQNMNDSRISLDSIDSQNSNKVTDTTNEYVFVPNNIKSPKMPKKKCKLFKFFTKNTDSDVASSYDSTSRPNTSCDDQINGSMDSLSEYSHRRLSTTESEDSFQIQFCDNPTTNLRPADSEDSIIFTYSTDDESDLETGEISTGLSKSLGNLADDSLYDEEDEVDCAMMKEPDDAVDDVVVEEHKTGILWNLTGKSLKRICPSKSVRFSSAPPRVLVMRVWSYAARCARAGHWEQHAADRERFKRRISEVDRAISWTFKPEHREKVILRQRPDPEAIANDDLKHSQLTEKSDILPSKGHSQSELTEKGHHFKPELTEEGHILPSKGHSQSELTEKVYVLPSEGHSLAALTVKGHILPSEGHSQSELTEKGHILPSEDHSQSELTVKGDILSSECHSQLELTEKGHILPSEDHSQSELTEKGQILPSKGHSQLELTEKGHILPSKGHSQSELTEKGQILPSKGHSQSELTEKGHIFPSDGVLKASVMTLNDLVKSAVVFKSTKSTEDVHRKLNFDPNSKCLSSLKHRMRLKTI